MTAQSNCDPPVSSRPSCDARHPGVDSITGEVNRGDAIYAIAYGQVVLAGIPPNGAFDGKDPSAGGFGFYIVIEHNVYGTRFYSIYAHNEDVLVEVGDIVEPGDQIATMGDSGTGSVHLHFEIRRAQNLDWNASNPFRSQTYWPETVTELTVNFVNLGPVFGYHDTYTDWAAAHP